MNRRSLIQKLIGCLAVLLPSRLFAKKEAGWKYLAISTRDIPPGLGIDGGIKHILEDLTVCANQAIVQARKNDEPLVRMEFSWRRIRVDDGEACFARFVAVYGNKYLGNLDAMPNGTLKFTPFKNANG